MNYILALVLLIITTIYLKKNRKPYNRRIRARKNIFYK